MTTSQVSSLDNAFLFSISSVTLVFASMQPILGGSEALLLFMPLLFSGLFYPFYAGYLRGSVEDSNIDRIRGWICFVGGTATYAAFISVVVGRDLYRSSDAGVIYFFAFALGYFVSKKVYIWVVSITGSHFDRRRRSIH